MRKLLALSYVILVAGFACLAHAQLTQTGAGKVAGGGGGGGGDFTSNLIHFWPMTNAQVVGTQITDTIGTGTNNGTANDVAIHVTSDASGPNGTYATARALDGGGTIQLTNPLFDWNSGSFTWSGWVKVTSNSSTGSGGSSQRIFNFDNLGNGTDQFQAIMQTAPAGTILVLTNATRANITSGSTLSNAPTWSHLTITNAGGGTGGTMTIYFNGVTAAQTAGSGSSTFSSATAWFGTGDGANGNWTGSFSAFRLYSRALSATDVSALFAAGG